MDIDECQQQPCANGGTCSNSNADFSCDCTPEYFGPKCRLSHDDCVVQSGDRDLCSHGQCVDLDRIELLEPLYACQCDPGYSARPGAQSCTEENSCAPYVLRPV